MFKLELAKLKKKNVTSDCMALVVKYTILLSGVNVIATLGAATATAVAPGDMLALHHP